MYLPLVGQKLSAVTRKSARERFVLHLREPADTEVRPPSRDSWDDF